MKQDPRPMSIMAVVIMSAVVCTMEVPRVIFAMVIHKIRNREGDVFR